MYWKIASLLIFAIFCLWCCIEMKIKSRKEDEAEKAFWEREARANAVRRKNIDHLDYIKIPDDLPVDLLKDNIEMPNILKVLDELKDQRILNLTGYTNTDLKLEYGAPNITELTLYDNNYTSLVTTLQKWVDLLLEAGYEEEAVKIMEFMVSTNVDIKKTYTLLGRFYLKHLENEKYMELIKTAESLRSINKKYIVEAVKALG